MRRIIGVTAVLLTAAVIFSLLSCGTEPQGADGKSVSFKDDLGRQVELSMSDRVAACHASFADCWLLAGGTLTAATTDAVEDHGLNVGNAAIVGTAKTVSAELLVASGATVALLSADLAAHLQLEAAISALGIRCIYFRVDDFEDYAYVMERLCAVTGRSELYLENVTAVRERIDALREKLPSGEGKSVLLMRAYSSGIKAKSDDNIAGVILKELGARNIADEQPSLLEDISLEYVVQRDPDLILVLTMGSEEAALGYLRENLENNPAFSGLSAVRNGCYRVLPKELFHYKPNENWDESYEYIAEILYPESLGNG
ncbi:MAG: ABC transporter substrate-binding protein [Clostridia bacterium]|nr:ABC transporter substrate-binding protein [Clostridia bacterium]